MGDYIQPATPQPDPTPINNELAKGLQASLARQHAADAVKQQVEGNGPYTATCLVGGCDWHLTHLSVPTLTLYAEAHRSLRHDWVKPGRGHKLT